MPVVRIVSVLAVALALVASTPADALAQKPRLRPQVTERSKAKPKAGRDRTRSNTRRSGSRTRQGKALGKVLRKRQKALKSKLKKAQSDRALAKRKQAQTAAKTQKQAAKLAKAKARQQARKDRRASKEKRKQDEDGAASASATAGGKDSRVIPETKEPIHEKLADPNFFGEKAEGGSSLPDTVKAAQWKGGGEFLDKLRSESGARFFSGDIGKWNAARFVNRRSRNDHDFRYAYGTRAFKNFIKADRMLHAIPRGKLNKVLTIQTISRVNEIAYAPGGDGLFTKLGKGMRRVLMPWADTTPGRLRRYQNMAWETKTPSPETIANLESHGARWVGSPTGKGGWILYARAKDVRPKLVTLLRETRNAIKSGADPVKISARFVQKFIALHPYPDGNGRTARLVMDRILAERGIVAPILANTTKDVTLTTEAYAKEIAQGVHRSARLLGVSPGADGLRPQSAGLKSAAKYVDQMFSHHGHTIEGVASAKQVKVGARSVSLGKDGFVYDSAGRPYLADRKGNLKPLSQMTHYLMVRRLAQSKNAPATLQRLTTPTRTAFAKLAEGGKSSGVKVLSDVKAIKHDGRFAVDVSGMSRRMVLETFDPDNIDPGKMFSPDKGTSPLTQTMSRYQQLDLELWYLKRAFKSAGDRKAVARVEKHRDKLFERARAELRKHVKKDLAADDNPLGARYSYERIQYKYSPLRYSSRKAYIKKHGDDAAFIYRGENFAKWTGVLIDGRPFRPGLKKVAGIRARRLGAGNMFDHLESVEGDTIGSGVQSYTTDLGLLSKKGGFADKHKSLKVNLGAMNKFAKGLVGLRIKDGETIEVTSKTGLISALLSRGVVTRPGHVSIRDIDGEQLHSIVRENVPTKAEKVLTRVKAAQKKAYGRGIVGRLAARLRGPSRFSVKLDDVLSEGEVKQLSSAISRSRNMITVTRSGDDLDVTAHRRALVFKVKKTDMLPGIRSIGGGFEVEQEVHVMANVLPHRIRDTFSQKQLVVETSPQAASPAGANAGTSSAAAAAGGM